MNLDESPRYKSQNLSLFNIFEE